MSSGCRPVTEVPMGASSLLFLGFELHLQILRNFSRVLSHVKGYDVLYLLLFRARWVVSVYQSPGNFLPFLVASSFHALLINTTDVFIPDPASISNDSPTTPFLIVVRKRKIWEILAFRFNSRQDLSNNLALKQYLPS
ncbi:hypothetical protein H2248_002936 [Termitomyces sp. 'cryptogamus']|nr:hypothetical protein H2248_002936 [Termitomyces sp. 'cryptogamus']